MTDNQALERLSPRKKPTELLETQAQTLADIYQLQLEQQKVLNAMFARPQHRVKVVDANMPFWNLVGFIIKITLAAIPAYIILGFIALVVWFILTVAGCTALALLQPTS
jgi:hypothetical protein